MVGAHGRAPAAEPGEAIGGHGREVSAGAQADDRDAVVVYKRAEGAPRAIGSAKWPVIRDARDTWKRRRERSARVVYLTPDADEALEELENGVTYVVAGLVDRPVRKNCTRDAANLHGCEVRRLPLREFRGAMKRGGARAS